MSVFEALIRGEVRPSVRAAALEGLAKLERPDTLQTISFGRIAQSRCRRSRTGRATLLITERSRA